MWSILLTTLKFLGLTVSGLAGYISAVPEPEDKKAQKPPPHYWLGRKLGVLLSKQWALRWVVIGLGVALLSQSVETIKSAHDTKEAREKDRQQISRAEEQIRLAKDSLDTLSTQAFQARTILSQVHTQAILSQLLYSQQLREKTRFEAFTLQASFRAGYLNSNLAPLLSRLREIGLPMYDKHIREQKAKTPSNVVTVGGVGPVPGTPVSFEFNQTNLWLRLSPDSITNNESVKQLPEIVGLRSAMTFLTQPRFTLLFYKKPQTAELEPQFYLTNCTPTEITLTYSPADDCFVINWRCEISKTIWHQTSDFTSLIDMTGSLMILSLENGQSPFPSMSVNDLTITFDYDRFEIKELIKFEPTQPGWFPGFSLSRTMVGSDGIPQWLFGHFMVPMATTYAAKVPRLVPPDY